MLLNNIELDVKTKCIEEPESVKHNMFIILLRQSINHARRRREETRCRTAIGRALRRRWRTLHA